MMHVPGTVRGWILPPWEGGPLRLPSLFFFFEEEALHASQTCQLQQYRQTAKENLWD